MLLRNFDIAVKYFDYKNKTELDINSSPKINGWYKSINGLITALIVVENKLFFLYGESDFLVTESSKVLLKEKNKIETEFVLFQGHIELVKFLLLSPNIVPSVSPFEYIEDDDFKWGIFIARIINDKERQRNFILNIMQ